MIRNCFKYKVVKKIALMFTNPCNIHHEWCEIKKKLIFNLNYSTLFSFSEWPWINQGEINMSIDSLYCSSPRKSLVKGERFMRGLKRNQSKMLVVLDHFVYTDASNLMVYRPRWFILLNNYIGKNNSEMVYESSHVVISKIIMFC